MRTLPLLSVSALALTSAFVACRNAEPPAQPAAATPAAASATAPTATAPAPAAAAAPAAAPSGAPAGSAVVTTPSSMVADDAPATAACGWSPDKAPVANWRTLIHSDDPSFGPANAKVTVVEFFEPNCPHCQHLHPTIKMVQRAFPNVRFVYKPVVFWPHSMMQANVLYAAQAAGKFEAMLDAQMAASNPQTGLQEAQLRPMLTQVGMNADATMQAVSAGTYRQKMMANRQDFGATGVTTVPLVLINGKVMGQERTTGCFGQLLREAEAAG